MKVYAICPMYPDYHDNHLPIAIVDNPSKILECIEARHPNGEDPANHYELTVENDMYNLQFCDWSVTYKAIEYEIK